MAEYQLSPLAEADVQEITATTIAQWGVQQAKKYVEQLHNTLITLVNNPNLGRPRDEISASIKSFPSGKHVVFYLSVDQGIEVARILHQRMDPSSQFDELT
ncbi:type II toxin-antitoxin system RelE/ParE family toxin [Arsukibacterium sp.]|uniref:type II toxin-antitoxin system RelE/ParE family toxin n=1 Tax=Arsukibacterium sp. TaxID=1977258 RepID=UPI001BD207A6|nr:type II toxin-antitoxin system RelE/ParE family toxin [Arsukibacterium sp.]